MAFRNDLVTSYQRAKQLNPNMGKGEFMMRAFPGRYKNRDSAYQAYNKTVKGERPGKKLEYYNREAQPPVRGGQKFKDVGRRPRKKPGYNREPGVREPRPGGQSPGLWKINVTFTFITGYDDDGNAITEDETRSFIAYSEQYQSLIDIPYIEEIIIASVDEYIVYWIENDSLTSNYINKQVEVVPIYRTDVHGENIVNIDTIEELSIEDYE